MTAPEPGSEPADLLAEAGWLRGLARSLTSDPELALELEQETWRAALARPPRAGPDLRAWLRSVARNFLRRGRRDALARRWHEAAAAGPEAAEEEATLERLELQARVVEAVRALAEPYRTAVTLRHLDGLDYDEVARRTGVDEAAARQRVSRGLKQLRGRLDRTYGGRAQWGVLAFALGRDLPVPSSAALAAAGSAGAAALLGGLGMSAGIKVAAVAAAGVLVAGGLWWGVREHRTDAQPERAAARPAAPESALAGAHEQPEAALAASGDSRSAVVPVPGALPEASAAPEPGERITGVVLDLLGAPVPGAEVMLLRFLDQDYRTLDLERQDERVAARTRADAGGRFALPAEPHRAYALRARVAGLAPAELRRAFSGDDVELRLRPGAAIAGLVLRPDDLPALGARLRLRPGNEGHGIAQQRAETDAGGGYRFEGLEAGAYVLEVSSSEGATPSWIKLSLEAGEERRVDVHLERGVELRGRVVDGSTGLPIAGAEVGESWVFRKWVATDDDGRFVYPDFPHEGYVDLSVRARGFGWKTIEVRGYFEAAQDRELPPIELFPSATVSGRIVAADGSALGDVYVACAASVHVDVQQIDWRAARTDAAGRYRIEDVRSDLPHALFLQRDGLGTAVFELGLPQREHAVPDLVLSRGVPIFGTVVDAAGAPRAGIEVTLSGSNADRATRFEQPLQASLDTYVGERSATTGPTGRFSFSDVSDGDYEVVAGLRGSESDVRRACRVAGAAVDVGEIELGAGLSIRGRVVDPEGDGVGGVLVMAWHEGDSTPAEDAGLITRAGGDFELADLRPGTYRLELVPYEAREGRRFAHTLREGVPAGTADLVVRLVEAAELKARVVDSAGKPVANASVEMVVATGEPGGWQQSDAEGRVAFYPPRGSKVALVAHPEKAGAEADKPYQYDPDPARAARLDGVDPERGEVVLALPGPH